MYLFLLADAVQDASLLPESKDFPFMLVGGEEAHQASWHDGAQVDH